MAKIILIEDGRVLQEMVLSKERITIGRRPHNDLVIGNLAISGDHAAIITILNDSFLEDLGSTNGTLVNGQLVKKHFLQNNDVIELANYQIKYQIESEREFASESLHSTAHAESGALPQAHPAASAPAAAPAVAESRLASIKILNGTSSGKEQVLSKALITVGRPGVQVAVITRRPQGYFITHVEGAATPLLNGVSIGNEAHALQHADVIELSGTQMEFSLK
jgi:pSer/pThr/pTyr-binding forkhead associated (FHA) protein